MDNNSIYIAGFFIESDKSLLNELCEDLQKNNISLSVRNLSGSIYNAALDFIDLEIITISFELLKTFIFSGGYDMLKFFILKLWRIAKKDKTSRVPFTFSIEGIPTLNGNENIKCKVSEPLSKEQREQVVDKVVELAERIEKHQFELLKRSQYFNAFNAHIFSFDPDNGSLSEVDITKEILNLMNNDSDIVH